MNFLLFWRLKVNLSSPHGEELEGLWSKWPFPREFITQFTKKSIEKNQFIGKTWKGWSLWHELDCLLSLSWLFVVHTARWDYSNLIPLRWIPRVNIVQMCPWNNFPKTQFRSKSRCQTRQWPRRWWIWTKRRRRNCLTGLTRQTWWVRRSYFEVFKMHWWKKEIRIYDIHWILSIYIWINIKKIYGFVHHHWFSRHSNTNKHVLTHLCVDLSELRTQHPFLVHPFPRCAGPVLQIHVTTQRNP